MSELQNARIHISGIVQGVGFRPFVYNLAQRLQLLGWVQNTSAGVDIEVDGKPETLDEFIKALSSDTPPLARIDQVSVVLGAPNGFSTFEIAHSAPVPQAFQPISPDVTICPDCLKELFDPSDRRYRYPFINCTNCGPRLTIITDLPYDRPNTTMADFPFCPDCAIEYHDPLNRRFHAQPVACPVCGPHVWLEYTKRDSEPISITRKENSIYYDMEKHQPRIGDKAIIESQRLLANGQVLAVKGLGGFHLACDATNREAVVELRRRKLRVDKPFAIMMPDIQTVQDHCYLGEEEREILLSRERPIVLLQRKPGSPIVAEVAPNQETLGVMLPYTPLHYLLFTSPDSAELSDPADGKDSPITWVLVMTSGNQSEEPIAIDNDEARIRLASLADAFLLHNRPIRTRCDDSVVRVFHRKNSNLFSIRRSRGYVPFPIDLPWESPLLLGAGAELKNTFCLTRGRYAFLSHHIGDMENYETLRSYEDGITHFEHLFRIHPEALAYDLHPNYLASRYAIQRAQSEAIPAFGIQHHHAHIAACLTENKLPALETVIGVSFDGTGYGSDGAIWGGEFLLANCKGYKRVAHLEYVPLPGGDASIRRPARIALSHLWQSGLEWNPDLPPVASLSNEEREALRSQLDHQINTQFTSSVGRLFDAVAALSGVRQRINYEAQAAIELEALVDPNEDAAYFFDIVQSGNGEENQEWTIRSQPVLAQVIGDYLTGTPASQIAARFHNGLARLVLQLSLSIRSYYGISSVALSGGVWQNLTLLQKTLSLLESEGFIVYTHRQVPTNDGGIALGQAVIAAANLLNL